MRHLVCILSERVRSIMVVGGRRPQGGREEWREGDHTSPSHYNMQIREEVRRREGRRKQVGGWRMEREV